MKKYRVLVIGGYGFFGRRLVHLLSQRADVEVIVAGRSWTAAERLVQSMASTARAHLVAHFLDVDAPSFCDNLLRLAPDVVVHTAGPFQGQSYGVAQSCIAVGAHYIDLADGREFVNGISVLDAAARQAGVLVTSGASSVPALSSAVADTLAAGLQRVTDIDIGISPGNRTERGLSTVQAILGYCGKPLPNGTVGWRKSYSHHYPAPVGPRLLSPCDVPDLVLLGARYPGVPRVRFGAGLELAFLHRGMNFMAWLAQLGVVQTWSAHAPVLKQVADWFQSWGSDSGGMHVSVAGRTAAGQDVRRHWSLIALAGDGPYVPTLAAAALVRQLARGIQPTAGARPCIGMLTLEDFQREAQELNITMKVQP